MGIPLVLASRVRSNRNRHYREKAARGQFQLDVDSSRTRTDLRVGSDRINISGTFYYLCSVLDGYSRYLVHWEIREAMTEAEVEIILQRAREQFPRPSPRIISDNGPQFIARDFKEFIRL